MAPGVERDLVIVVQGRDGDGPLGGPGYCRYIEC